MAVLYFTDQNWLNIVMGPGYTLKSLTNMSNNLSQTAVTKYGRFDHPLIDITVTDVLSD